MEFSTLLELIGADPVFESSLLLSGKIDPKIVRLQLSRWVNSGRIYQLRRGLYAIAPPYQKTIPHPFLVANRLQRSSYVSLQSALSFHGLIPDIVNITTSVSGGRPEIVETPVGIFEYRHIKPVLLFGYRMQDLGGQEALVASPEKALLDLVYLTPGGETPAFLQGLRLQNLDHLNLNNLKTTAMAFDSPKIDKATAVIIHLKSGAESDYEDL